MTKVIPTRKNVMVALEAIMEQHPFPFSIRRSLQLLANSNLRILYRNKQEKKKD